MQKIIFKDSSKFQIPKSAIQNVSSLNDSTEISKFIQYQLSQQKKKKFNLMIVNGFIGSELSEINKYKNFKQILIYEQQEEWATALIYNIEQLKPYKHITMVQKEALNDVENIKNQNIDICFLNPDIQTRNSVNPSFQKKLFIQEKELQQYIQTLMGLCGITQFVIKLPKSFNYSQFLMNLAFMMNFYESQIIANVLKPKNCSFILLFADFSQLSGSPPKRKQKQNLE